VRLGHLVPGQTHATLDDQLRDVRQSVAHLHQRHAPGEIRECNTEHRDLLELTQGLDLPLRIVRREALRSRAEFPNEARAGRRLVEGVGIDEFVEQQGKIRDLSRQEPAYRANIDEALQCRRLFLQQGKVGRTCPDGLQHA